LSNVRLQPCNSALDDALSRTSSLLIANATMKRSNEAHQPRSIPMVNPCVSAHTVYIFCLAMIRAVGAKLEKSDGPKAIPKFSRSRRMHGDDVGDSVRGMGRRQETF
jgi:hypothetical protein